MNIISSLRDIELYQRKPLVDAEVPDDMLKRKALERKAISILLSPEKEKSQATPRQLDSGFNEVLARIAAKNKIALGININELRKDSLKQKAERMTRIKQNIVICRKAKVRLALKTDTPEARFVLLSLAASSQQAAEAQCF